MKRINVLRQCKAFGVSTRHFLLTLAELTVESVSNHMNIGAIPKENGVTKTVGLTGNNRKACQRLVVLHNTLVTLHVFRVGPLPKGDDVVLKDGGLQHIINSRVLPYCFSIYNMLLNLRVLGIDDGAFIAFVLRKDAACDPDAGQRLTGYGGLLPFVPSLTTE